MQEEDAATAGHGWRADGFAPPIVDDVLHRRASRWMPQRVRSWSRGQPLPAHELNDVVQQQGQSANGYPMQKEASQCFLH